MSDLHDYKHAFIRFMLDANVLRFGDFTTKSGRRTPYFINTGHYDSGASIQRLGAYYAQALMHYTQGAFDALYGPAYKGIPLAVTTASALATEHDRDVGFVFNRKEPKDHGEGGVLVGHRLLPGERVVLIDDVVTAGTSVRESMAILEREADVKVTALIVSVDRQERGTGERSALQELQDDYGLATWSIVSLDDIVDFLQASDGFDQELLARMRGYREQYGVG